MTNAAPGAQPLVGWKAAPVSGAGFVMAERLSIRRSHAALLKKV